MTGTDTAQDSGPCPSWCVSDHTQDAPGSVLWCHRSPKITVISGPPGFGVDFAAVTLQYPYAGPPETRAPFVLAHLEATGRLMRAADVTALADMLSGYADRLRKVADGLAIAQGQHERE